MENFIKETLFVKSSSYEKNMISFGMDDESNFYISDGIDDVESIYLSFTFDNWIVIKKFIDDQFRKKNILY